MIDAHRHFWRYTPSSHAWIDDSMAVLKRDFLPGQSLVLGEPCDGCIAVQAVHDPAETGWLLAASSRNPSLVGVVGWVDLCDPGVADELDRLAEHPRFVGVRHLVQDEPDPHFLARADFRRGLAELAARELCFDLLVRAPQREAAIDLARSFPEQRFVLDHLGKPRARDGELEPWRRQMRELAQYENVSCKLSGLCTEADPARWKEADLAPYVEHALEVFGPARLLFGSDYPVCALAGPPERVAAAHLAPLRGLSPCERRAIAHDNALRIYGLRP